MAEEYIDVGYELGLKIAENGHTLVFGGGDDGIMGAVASGVFDGGCDVIGIAPTWIDEFDSIFQNCSEFIRTDTLDERKNLFLEKSDVLIVCPGGVGTLDEFFGILTLKLTKRHSKPIIIFNIDNFYDTMLTMLYEMREKHLVRDGVLEDFEVVTSVEEIFQLIE